MHAACCRLDAVLFVISHQSALLTQYEQMTAGRDHTTDLQLVVQLYGLGPVLLPPSCMGSGLKVCCSNIRILP
jgi:hypothetical protein